MSLGGGSVSAHGGEHRQGLPRVPRGAQLGGVHVPDYARPVDHVRDPARQQAQRLLDAVQPAHGAVAVGQQEERQPVPLGEPAVRADGVRAHADHLGALGGESVEAVAERARLEGAPRCFVLGIEVQHDRPLAEQIMQPDRLAPLVGQREVGRHISDTHLLLLRHASISPQCAVPTPPGIPLLLCITNSSGRDSTKHAPNKRNRCSNDSIIACFVTWPSRIASAFASARPGGVPLAISVAVMPPSRSRVASLNCVTFAASSARLMAANRCNSVAETAIPTLPPSWRIRLNNPVPFGILLMGRSARARFVRGTKISPRPTPRKINGQKKSGMPLSVVKCPCFHIERAKIETPAKIESRPSNLPVKRPIAAIVNALASAPGRITNPVCSAVKCCRFCR